MELELEPEEGSEALRLEVELQGWRWSLEVVLEVEAEPLSCSWSIRAGGGVRGADEGEE